MAKTLARLEIDAKQAEQVIQKLDQLFKLLQQDAQTTAKTVGGAFKSVATETTGLEQATRGFLREQRFQDRIIRETSQSLTGLAFAFSYLTSSNKDASKESKKFAEALMAGAIATNTIEMAMFGLGQAGARMGGTLGKLVTGLSGWGGAIAMGIGILVAFISIMGKADEATEKFNERMSKTFEEQFGKLSLNAQKAQVAQNEQYLKTLNIRQDTLEQESALTYAQLEAKNIAGEDTKELRAQYIISLQNIKSNKESVDWATKRLEKIKLITEDAEKEFQYQAQTNKALSGSLNLIQTIAKELNTVKGEIESGKDSLTGQNLTLEQIQERQERIVTLESQKAELSKTTGERYREQVELSNELYRAMLAVKEVSEDRNKFEQDAWQDATANEDFFRNLETENAEKRAKDEEEKHKERIARYEELIEIGRQAGYSIAQGIAAGEPVIHSILKSILVEILDFLEKYFIAVIIKNNLENIMAGGMAGLIKAAAETAVITAMFETAKSQIMSYDKGGYTGRGGANEPAGMVHRGEIVFEKPIVDRYGAELMSLRSSLQSGGGFNDKNMINELRGLRRDVSGLQLKLKGLDVVLAYDRNKKLSLNRQI